MEQQQEFHSLTTIDHGAASHDQLELSSFSSTPPSPSISSSSSAPSSPSSSPSSPDPNSSTMSSPPIADHLPAQHSVTITIVPAPPISQKRLFLTREQALTSLKESIPHSMKLQRLQKSEKDHQKDARRHKRNFRRLGKELYLIVSLYALLQGVIFAAVAQSSVYTCTDLWGPTVIIGAVTLATISGALDKLRRMRKEKQEVQSFQRRQSAVYDKIELLHWKGSTCSIESLDPAVNITDRESGMVCNMFSARALLVLGFLVGFSGLIWASCWRMLCGPCQCTHRQN